VSGYPVAQGSRIIQEPDDRPRPAPGGHPCQGALARLAGTVDQDDACVLQRFVYQGLCMTVNEIRYRGHPRILPYEQ